MILNKKDIKRIKKFIINEPTEDEVSTCTHCGFTTPNGTCKNKDICEKYTPIMIGDEMLELVKDLFDTIEDLQK